MKQDFSKNKFNKRKLHTNFTFFLYNLILICTKGAKMTKFCRNFHIYLSLFFLPVALMYALTGVLYIAGVNQDWGATKQTYLINQNIPNGEEKTIVWEYLKSNQIALPSEKVSKNKQGNLTFGGTHYSVSLSKKGEESYELTTLKRSFIGDMIMLHKAKALWYFNILAIGFGITMGLLYLSGLIITLFNSKKNRNIQYFTIFLGFLASLVLGILSLS